MKYLNILSVAKIFFKFGFDFCSEYLKHFKAKIKEDELHDLLSLVRKMRAISKDYFLYERFFIGYSIPQIGKEFDLIRVGEKSIINIEIKRESTVDLIKRQLLRNTYYLKFLEKKVFVFSYISSCDTMYTLDDKNELVEVNIEKCIDILFDQDLMEVVNIDSFFDPANYLVSPFNSTKKFVDGEYFLTIHQEEMKTTILKNCLAPGASFYAIMGAAGTGKTLLAYDIVKQIRSSYRSIVIHCGLLNTGHEMLRDGFGWDVISIKEMRYTDFKLYDFILLDEVQRIYKGQFDKILDIVHNQGIKCLFAFDGRQTMSVGEAKNDIPNCIESIPNVKLFKLTEKIRTNKEVASFIGCLFEEKRVISFSNYQSIQVDFSNSVDDVLLLLTQLHSEGFKVINFTPLIHKAAPYQKYRFFGADDSAHSVIGQEFESVVAVIDKSFYYAEGRLVVSGYGHRPYDPAQMLYQIVSRTRSRLRLIIVDNQVVLERCIKILRGRSMDKSS